MNVHYNGVLMSEQSNAYHQKAYKETLLNYNRQERDTLLDPQSWVNEVNVQEELTPTDATNNDEPNPGAWTGETGLKEPTSRLLDKVHHTFMIKPHLAVFKTGKCLLPGIQIYLELFLNESNMFLFGTPDTTTSVNKKIPTLADDDIFVTCMVKVTLNASVYARLQIERALSKTKRVKYPVVRSEIRTFFFEGKSTRWERDNVFVGRVHDKVVIGLMNSKSCNGTLNCYCFAYEKFGVTRVRQTVDGEEYPYRALEMAGNTQAEDLLGYKPAMILPGDWGQGKTCTLYVFNNVPGEVVDPH